MSKVQLGLRVMLSVDYTNEYTGDYNELLYLRARYYAPGIGRFLTRDTWAGDSNIPLSFNRWNYVVGNPINLADPSGHDPWWCDDRPDRLACIEAWLRAQTSRTNPPPTTPMPVFTPTLSPEQIYQQYKSGPLTPWEARIGGQVSQNAHQLLANTNNYYFWGHREIEYNRVPPYAGENIEYPISQILTSDMLNKSWYGYDHFTSDGYPDGNRVDIDNLFGWTNNRIPFVCGDIPDWAYFNTGYNLQVLFPNVAAQYPNRWPRSSYGYLNMLYPDNWHQWDVRQNPFSTTVVPELGDVMVLQFGNDPYQPGTATHVVLVAEVYGNTADKVFIIEGNSNETSIVRHSVQELLFRVPDVKYLIFGHPNLP